MPVYIIGEDLDRSRPLLEALSSRGVRTIVWNTAGGALNPCVPPPTGDDTESAVFYCRQSPSADTRGHHHAVAYTKEVVRWLEFYGADVVNGSRVLDVECSKALQMMYCSAAGLNTPGTMMQQGLRQTMVQAAVGYRGKSLILKPNQGGSGTNVDAFTDARELQGALRFSRMAPSPDDLWVLQDLLGSFSRDPTVTKSVLRFEVIDGRVQRDYVVKITAPSAEFSLCPCDPRTEKILNSISFRILTNPLTVPGFDEDPAVFEGFCTKVEHAFELVGASVGSVETVVLWQEFPEQARTFPCPKEPVIFDMNFNTTYNPTAEAAAGITPGTTRLCDMLVRRMNAGMKGARKNNGPEETTLSSLPGTEPELEPELQPEPELELELEPEPELETEPEPEDAFHFVLDPPRKPRGTENEDFYGDVAESQDHGSECGGSSGGDEDGDEDDDDEDNNGLDSDTFPDVDIDSDTRMLKNDSATWLETSDHFDPLDFGFEEDAY
jgi:hypothetical protein